MQSVIHTVLSGANIGIFVLATLAFVVRFILGNRDDKLAEGADVVAYVAAGTGVALAVFTGLSGYFLTWPQDAIRSTLLTQNKVLATTALLVCWGMFFVLRWQVGKSLWKNLALKLWAMALVGFGFVNVVMLGSLGGSAALIGSLLDPALISLNINRFVSIAWLPVLSVILILIGVLGFLFPMFQRNRR
ncbi:MAG: hypothetical protein R6V73_13010 [Anaerolineales bacterium]|jgi:hypothetical protein